MVGWLVVTVALGGAATLVMVIVLRSVRRTLGGDLETALEQAKRISGGHLSGRVPAASEDSGSLLGALWTMQDNLIGLVRRIQVGSENVNTGADEISAENLDLSQRTEEQAAALVQTAYSMDRMTANARESAEGA